MATITTLSQQGAMTQDLETIINNNFTNLNNALGAGAIAGSQLVANTVATGQLDPTTIQYASFTYTLAQLLATNSAPRTLVAAQGAGTLIEVVSLVLDLTRGSNWGSVDD